MKNIKQEFDDSLRQEYKQSDFGELVQGKYAVSEVQFAELTELLLACIGEEEAIQFTGHSIGNYLADHKLGEWTYEIDNANQVTLRFWLNSLNSVSETISNPPSVMTPQDKAQLQNALLKGVMNLKAKASHARRG